VHVWWREDAVAERRVVVLGVVAVGECVADLVWIRVRVGVSVDGG
jgi:hypothetical protein